MRDAAGNDKEKNFGEDLMKRLPIPSNELDQRRHGFSRDQRLLTLVWAYDSGFTEPCSIRFMMIAPLPIHLRAGM